MSDSEMQQDGAVPLEAEPSSAAKKDRLQKKQHYNARINELAAQARPSEVTEVGRRKLFEDWERAGKMILQAEKMLEQAKAWRITAAEEIVKKLGRGQWRYKDVLYSVTAKTHKDGTTVYLRPMAPKAIDV